MSGRRKQLMRELRDLLTMIVAYAAMLVAAFLVFLAMRWVVIEAVTMLVWVWCA